MYNGGAGKKEWQLARTAKIAMPPALRHDTAQYRMCACVIH